MLITCFLSPPLSPSRTRSFLLTPSSRPPVLPRPTKWRIPSYDDLSVVSYVSFFGLDQKNVDEYPLKSKLPSVRTPCCSGYTRHWELWCHNNGRSFIPGQTQHNIMICQITKRILALPVSLYTVSLTLVGGGDKTSTGKKEGIQNVWDRIHGCQYTRSVAESREISRRRLTRRNH